MAECTVEIGTGGPDAGVPTATICGEMTIVSAAQLREGLLELLNAGERLCVDLSGVSAMDLTGLQLLCAAHRAANTAGKTLEVRSDGNEAVETTIRAAGFPRQTGCADDKKNTCIWVGGFNG